MDDNESASLVKILSLIYCRAICREFRLPVEILYPGLLNTYLSVIKYPMDIGTLLLAAMKKKMKVSNYRDGLRLVFSNAIKFNNDSDLMINISKHLDKFACGLYEEAFCLPYRSNATTPVTDEFLRKRLSSRLYLYSLLRFEPLKLSELKTLMESLQSTAIALQAQLSQNMLTIPLELITVIDASIKIASNALDTYQISAGTSPPRICMNDALRPILEFIRSIGHPQGISDVDLKVDHILICQLPPLFILLSSMFGSPLDSSHRSPTPDVNKLSILARVMTPYLQYFRMLDESLGVLLVCVYERVYRGCVYSAIWATPHACVITKQGRLAITLVGPLEQGFPSQLCSENLNRLPHPLLTALARGGGVRNVNLQYATNDMNTNDPNYASSYPMVPPLIPADGRILVEYLDTHDIQWMYSEDLTRVTYRDLQAPSIATSISSPQEVLTLCIKIAAWMENRTSRFVDNLQYRISRHMDTTTPTYSLVGEDTKADLDIPFPTQRQLERSLNRTAVSSTPSTANSSTPATSNNHHSSTHGSGHSADVPSSASSSANDHSGTTSTTPVNKSTKTVTPKSSQLKSMVINADKPQIQPTLPSSDETVESNDSSSPTAANDIVIDGVRLSSLFKRGLFLSSKCPTEVEAKVHIKKHRAILKCRYFGAWVERSRVIKQNLLQDDTGLNNDTASDTPPTKVGWWKGKKRSKSGHFIGKEKADEEGGQTEDILESSAATPGDPTTTSTTAGGGTTAPTTSTTPTITPKKTKKKKENTSKLSENKVNPEGGVNTNGSDETGEHPINNTSDNTVPRTDSAVKTPKSKAKTKVKKESDIDIGSNLNKDVPVVSGVDGNIASSTEVPLSMESPSGAVDVKPVVKKRNRAKSIPNPDDPSADLTSPTSASKKGTGAGRGKKKAVSIIGATSSSSTDLKDENAPPELTNETSIKDSTTEGDVTVMNVESHDIEGKIHTNGGVDDGKVDGEFPVEGFSPVPEDIKAEVGSTSKKSKKVAKSPKKGPKGKRGPSLGASTVKDSNDAHITPATKGKKKKASTSTNKLHPDLTTFDHSTDDVIAYDSTLTVTLNEEKFMESSPPPPQPPLKKMKRGPVPSSTPKNVYTPVITSCVNTGIMFDKTDGCCKYISGEGVIHTRSVNFQSPLFFREAKNGTIRKHVLEIDLMKLKKELIALQEAATLRSNSTPDLSKSTYGYTSLHDATYHNNNYIIPNTSGLFPPPVTLAYSATEVHPMEPTTAVYSPRSPLKTTLNTLSKSSPVKIVKDIFLEPQNTHTHVGDTSSKLHLDEENHPVEEHEESSEQVDEEEDQESMESDGFEEDHEHEDHESHSPMHVDDEDHHNSDHDDVENDDSLGLEDEGVDDGDEMDEDDSEGDEEESIHIQ